MSTISTHVLDNARGIPAEGVPLELETQSGDHWHRIGGGTTNDDGRVNDLLTEVDELEPGIYRMTFQTGEYFDKHDIDGFYPVARVVFEVDATDEHYHVPLLLSPYGYTTYRGS
ncbi:MAG: hydroxyisourate hydrolase [Bradymonadaceae bacterium]